MMSTDRGMRERRRRAGTAGSSPRSTFAAIAGQPGKVNVNGGGVHTRRGFDTYSASRHSTRIDTTYMHHRCTSE